MKGNVKGFLLMAISLCIAVQGYHYRDDVRHLKLDVFNDTDPLVPPVISYMDKVHLNVVVYLSVLFDLDVTTQTMVYQIGFIMQWTDEEHMWDPTLYGNVSEIQTNSIWTPSLVIANNVEAPFTLDNVGYNPSIRQNGSVTYILGKLTKTTCRINVAKFPFDSHSCDIVIMNSRGSDVSFHNATIIDYSKMGLGVMETSNEWEITDSNILVINPDSYKSIVGEEYMIVTIKLRRHYLFYFLTVIFPCILITFSNQCVFLIPIGCGEKISYSVSIMLSFSIFLGIIHSLVPRTPNPVSGFLVYAILSFAVSVIATFGTILTEHFYNTENKKNRVPSLLWKLITRDRKDRKTVEPIKVKEVIDNSSLPNNILATKEQANPHIVKEYNLENLEKEWKIFAFELNNVLFKLTCGMTLINTAYFLISLVV